MESQLDFGRFEALTFDCYGTLIDWESGILAALRAPMAAFGVTDDDETLLSSFADAEAQVEAGTYRPYRNVLEDVLNSMLCERDVLLDEDVDDPREDGIYEAFVASVVEWPAFPDSAAALARLHERFKLGVITNCDDDLFAASERRLGVSFDWVVTAEQVGAYKPSERNFEVAFERLGLPRDRILHCAQSLFHDHVPGKRLGLSTVWVDRRHGRPGGGATPPAAAEPDLTVPDLATLAELAVS